MKKLLLLISLFITASLAAQNTHNYNVATVTGNTNAVLPYVTVGDYVNDNFQRSSFGSNYTLTNPNATITFPSSLRSHFTGGNATMNNFVQFTNGGTNFAPDKYEVEIQIIVSSNAATDAFIYGAPSVISVNQASYFAKIDLGTANSASLNIYNSVGLSTLIASASGLTFVVGDTLKLKINRLGPSFSYKLTDVNNRTSIGVPYVYDRTLSSNYEPNLATPTMYFYHGTGDIVLFHITDLTQKNANAIILSHSIGEGYKTTAILNDWESLCFSHNTQLYDISAGVSEQASDAIGRLQAIINANPKYTPIYLGANEIVLGTSHTVFKTNMDTIVTRLIRAGITPILLALTPINANNVTTNFNPDLQALATAHSIKYVDIFTPLANGTAIAAIYDAGDGVHPNNAGHGLIAETIRNACPELFASYSTSIVKLNRLPVVSPNTVKYIQVMDSNGNAAQTPLNLSFINGPQGGDKAIQYDSAGANSGNVNTLSWDYVAKTLNLPTLHTTEPGAWFGGFSITPFANDNQIFLSNAYYNGGIKYKTTDFMEGFEFTGGVIYMFCAPSGTANAAVIYKNPFQALSDGSVKIGNPTAFGTVFNFNVLPTSITMATSVIATGGATDNYLVASSSAGVSTIKQVAAPIFGTGVLDFPSTGAGAVADLTVTVTGAALGDVVMIGVPNGSLTTTATFWGWVSSANTVTIRFSPKGTEDPASGTFKATIIK